ncbi:FMN-binding negative transcriptional regulator [Sphingomonas sp.]|uniref:FMN-binding negative transcriptional regulator n=1 Tax=Sphingomonas sp. TaxID=28214 RepID=UPI0035B0D975
MYRPPAFQEDRTEILHRAIRSYPLATLVTYGTKGITANLIPFSLHVDAGAGVLTAHLAKANDQLRDLQSRLEALVIFQGPQAYVSPSWYATKQEHGKAVPTWNYIVVQARGLPELTDDKDWLLTHVDGLTEAQEHGRRDPWSVSDAPADFIAAQLKGITGLRLPIARLEGKWKVSQNQPAANKAGIIAGLGSTTDMASAISGLS